MRKTLVEPILSVVYTFKLTLIKTNSM